MNRRSYLYPSLCQLSANKFLLDLSRERFERLALGLGDQQGRKDTRQHEQSKNLEAEERA